LEPGFSFFAHFLKSEYGLLLGWVKNYYSCLSHVSYSGLTEPPLRAFAVAISRAVRGMEASSFFFKSIGVDFLYVRMIRGAVPLLENGAIRLGLHIFPF